MAPKHLPYQALLLVVLCAAAATGGAGAADAGQQQQQQNKKFPVRLEDIVIAYPADDRHIVVAKASRIWRKGVMRTFIANNHPPSAEIIADGKLHNETWSYYPDDNPRRSMYPGDSRAGLVPFLAHKAFGDTYKWLLYMDDDTIFFPDAVQRLLEDFDPDIPYFITDHLWWPDPLQPPHLHISNHPNKAAPRCLPCHFNTTPFEGVEMPFPAPKGCPCTPQLLCEAAAKHNMTTFNRYCDIPRAPITVYSMHGGAGGIMSIGLMRRVSFEFMERCTKSLYSTGGDAFISICLWQAGYAITDPGLGLFHPDLQYFDPGPEDRIGAMLKLSQYIDNSATKQCDRQCELQLEHMVSLHVRSRMFNTLDDAASFIRGVSIMYEVYADIRRSKQQQEAAAVAAAAVAASFAATADAAAAAAKPQAAASAAGAVAAAAGATAGAAGAAQGQAAKGTGGAAAAAASAVKPKEAVKATAAAAAAAVAAAATAKANEVGPDGRPLSQSELKQKELAKALAEDAAAHQDDHRNATAVLQMRAKAVEKAAASAAEAQQLERAAAAAAKPKTAGVVGGGVGGAQQQGAQQQQAQKQQAAAAAAAGAGAAAAGAAAAAGRAGAGGAVAQSRKLSKL